MDEWTPYPDLVDRQVYLVGGAGQGVGVYRAETAEVVCCSRTDTGPVLYRTGVEIDRGNVPPAITGTLPIRVPGTISLDPVGPLVCSKSGTTVTEHLSEGGAVRTYRHPRGTICSHPIRNLPNIELLDFLAAALDRA